jgi:hypothetical protein
MSNSWGHALEQLSVQRLFDLARSDARTEARGGTYFYGTCTIGRVTHNEPATYVSSYNYVTGRAGRVSWASKRICADHAVRFAAKHGLDINAAPTQRQRPRHASEQALEALFGGSQP